MFLAGISVVMLLFSFFILLVCFWYRKHANVQASWYQTCYGFLILLGNAPSCYNNFCNKIVSNIFQCIKNYHFHVMDTPPSGLIVFSFFYGANFWRYPKFVLKIHFIPQYAALSPLQPLSSILSHVSKSTYPKTFLPQFDLDEIPSYSAHIWRNRKKKKRITTQLLIFNMLIRGGYNYVDMILTELQLRNL